MSALSGFLASHKILTAIVAVAVVGTAGGVAVAAQNRDKVGTVTHIVDGDTLDVRYGGEEHRVRLLNVDTPESVDPNSAVECLGPEATDFLAELLPVGTEVRLENDVELYDQYDRELAGVFLGETLVNAEIARAGFGAAVLYEPNDRFYNDVAAAQQEAKDAGTGLYATDIACTVPAQMNEYATAVDSAVKFAPATSADLQTLEARTATLLGAAATGAAVATLLDGDTSVLPLLAFTAGEIGEMTDRAARLSARTQDAIDGVAAARRAEEARLEAERIAREEAERRAAEEAARKAAEEEAARRAAAEEAARRTAAQEAARRSAQATSPKAPSSSGSATRSSGSSSGGSSSGGGGKYTGCRAYGGGYAPNAIDDKGRPYTKIDCTTKRPIG